MFSIFILPLRKTFIIINFQFFFFLHTIAFFYIIAYSHRVNYCPALLKANA